MAHTFQALPKSEGIGITAQDWVFHGTLLKVVVWDAGTQVVYVVETDIAGEPLEEPRQFVIGAALDGGL